MVIIRFPSKKDAVYKCTLDPSITINISFLTKSLNILAIALGEDFKEFEANYSSLYPTASIIM